MKKLLLIALLGAGYYFYSKKDSTTDDLGGNTGLHPTDPINPINPINPAPTGGTVYDTLFSLYDGKIIIDNKGYWAIVQGGKLIPPSQEDISKYPPAIQLDFDVWEYYATNDRSVFAV